MNSTRDEDRHAGLQDLGAHHDLAGCEAMEPSARPSNVPARGGLNRGATTPLPDRPDEEVRPRLP
ncbi:hypothetical protein LT493_11445 [Streptomyces tricolor]|nr:hypothetical protein [Streptomyces tricolor]